MNEELKRLMRLAVRMHVSKENSMEESDGLGDLVVGDFVHLEQLKEHVELHEQSFGGNWKN